MPAPTTTSLTPQQRRRIERWLTRRGLPHLISDYSAREDVLTRMVPFLALVFSLEMLLAIELDWPWYANVAAVIGGGLVLLAAYGMLNRAQGRPAMSLPARVGNGEIATFVLLPAVLPVLFGGDLRSAIGAIVGNVVTLLVAYAVTSYGLLPMVAWSVGQTIRHVSSVGRLAARALPMLLLFATFLFVNAELWQVAQDFTPATFTATLALFVGSGLLFFLLRLPRQTADIATFADWEDVRDHVRDTPAEEVPTPAVAVDDVPPLARADRLNVGLLLVVTQGVQIILVSALIGLFFLVFGLLAIREPTILAWTSAGDLTALLRLRVADTDMVLSTELVRVSAFIAAFSGLQFTVSASTDESWRQEFVDDVVADVRDALAVRAVCLPLAHPPLPLTPPLTPRN